MTLKSDIVCIPTEKSKQNFTLKSVEEKKTEEGKFNYDYANQTHHL